MKEYRAEPGGRYMYSDDVLNLQELALANNKILNQFGDFIIEGCEVLEAERKITNGCVFLDGKIRLVEEETFNSLPVYIVANDIDENVSYAEGGEKLGRTNCKAAISSSAPLNKGYIELGSERKDVKSEVAGKYNLLLSSDEKQVVDGDVEFSKDIATRSLIAKSLSGDFSKISSHGINIKGGEKELTANSGEILIKDSDSGKGVFHATSEDNLSKLSVGSTIELSSPIKGNSPSKISVGDLELSNNSIELKEGSGANELYINRGSKGNSNVLNTTICNGKGVDVINVNSNNKSISLNWGVQYNYGAAASDMKSLEEIGEYQALNNRDKRAYSFSVKYPFVITSPKTIIDAAEVFQVKSKEVLLGGEKVELNGDVVVNGKSLNEALKEKPKVPEIVASCSVNESGNIVNKYLKEGNVTASRLGNGTYRVTFQGLNIGTSEYNIIISGQGHKIGHGHYACVTQKTVNSFDVYTGDDASANDGSFNFLIIKSF